MSTPRDADVRKRLLRPELRTRRGAIAGHAARSVALWSAVAALPEWAAARTVMLYLSFGSEPDTGGLVAEALVSGRHVVVPRVDGHHLVAVPYLLGDPTEPSSFGVPEPTAEPVDPTTIDLAVVPGLAFTADGRRIGFGKGFYDRFLPGLRPGCVTVGACFSEMLLDDLPTGPFDHRLALVVTA